MTGSGDNGEREDDFTGKVSSTQEQTLFANTTESSRNPDVDTRATVVILHDG